MTTPQNEPQAPPAPLHPVLKVKGADLPPKAVQHLLGLLHGRYWDSEQDREWVYRHTFYYDGAQPSRFLGCYCDSEPGVKA